MTTRRMSTITLSLLLTGMLLAVTAVITILVIELGSHEMSWGERISRRESYVYIDGETLTQDDLAYIAGLRRLSSLTLTNCNVAECKLRELEFASDDLWSVDLTGTRGLWDLSFLSKLSARDLTLSDCPGIDDLSVLNLEAVEMLAIDGTEVSDLSPLAHSRVSHLSFVHTAVSDLSPLARLKELWWIDGSYTQVDSIDVLADFDGLWYVHFDGCPIGEMRKTFMSRHLNELSLSHTQATDLSGFGSCTELGTLRLGGNPELTDLSWLDRRCCETLVEVDLGQTGCTADEVSWVASCKGLQELTLDGIKLGNLDFCRRLPSLELLSAVDCGIGDIAGLSGCTRLESILLGYNKIKDVSGLPQPENAEFGIVLDLSHNRLASLGRLPSVRYRALLLQGNKQGLGRSVSAELDVYDLVLDWYEGMEYGPLKGHRGFAKIYLLGCPEDQQKVVNAALGSWIVTYVSEEELLELLETDDLAYSLWIDLGGYVEIARTKLGEESGA